MIDTAGGSTSAAFTEPLGPSSAASGRRLLLATRADQIRAARAREDQAFVERVGTPENLEAVMAFFEKRPPDFGKLRG